MRRRQSPKGMYLCARNRAYAGGGPAEGSIGGSELRADIERPLRNRGGRSWRAGRNLLFAADVPWRFTRLGGDRSPSADTCRHPLRAAKITAVGDQPAGGNRTLDTKARAVREAQLRADSQQNALRNGPRRAFLWPARRVLTDAGIRGWLGRSSLVAIPSGRPNPGQPKVS